MTTKQACEKSAASSATEEANRYGRSQEDNMYEQGGFCTTTPRPRAKETWDKLNLSHMISYYPIFVSVRSSAYAFQIKRLDLLIEQMRLHIPLAIGDPLKGRVLCTVEES